ncbi:MAG TPA: amidohydrolase family protein [Gammaproteobacteria bacterium]|nr:amidohydrolase family protein [Gammaproteobacteria bacterium]
MLSQTRKTSLYRSGMVFSALLGLASPAFADSPPAAQPGITAFVGVNVVPMDRERVLRGQTVLVEDGNIKAIGPDLAVPAGATVIDGHGTAYLSPGLADMHVHSDTAEDMKVYLANGVTTVLNMGHASEGFMDHVRPEVNADGLPGPHIYAGFMIDGSPQFGNFFVTTPAEARAVVDIAKTNGYDFIKVYNDLSPACFQALIEEGRRQHLHVIGHGVTRVGIEKQLAMGQVMVAHTEEFLYTVFSHPDLSAPNPAILDPTPPNPADIPRVIAFVKHDGAYVTADLNTYGTIARQWGKPDVVAGLMRSPELRYLSPMRRISWSKAGYDKKSGNVDANFAFLRRFTKDMADAGVSLITGTDSPSIPGLVPGFSLHDDMDLLVTDGLSRYQVLAAATRTPGEFIHRYVRGAEPFGTVAAGNRADLVLSAADPLQDLSTLRKPLGVMHDGHWYDATALQALLDGVAQEYDAAVAPH